MRLFLSVDSILQIRKKIRTVYVTRYDIVYGASYTAIRKRYRISAYQDRIRSVVNDSPLRPPYLAVFLLFTTVY